MFAHRVQALNACFRAAQQRESSAAPVSFSIDLQVASRGNVVAVHAVDPPPGQVLAVDCARQLLRRFRFNPGPAEDRAYRLRVAVGPRSRLEAWHRKQELLRVDDPTPPFVSNRRADAPSELERVLEDGKVTGTAAEVLGQAP